MTVPAPDSLAEVLEYLFEHDADQEVLYSYLEQIDRERLRRVIGRLNRIETATIRRKGKTRKAFEGQRSSIKGKLYEDLVATVVNGVQFFTSWRNVQSSTNELDFLIMLGPKARWIPAMRGWGDHCICECKYHATHVSTNWVTKLNTVLQMHGAAVGILFSKKGVAPKGRGSQIRHTLQLLAAGPTPTFILCVDFDDLLACANGEKFCRMVSARYMEVQAGLDRLSLASA